MMIHANAMKSNVLKAAAIDPMRITVPQRLKSIASLVVLPALLLASLFALGRGLDGIIHEGQSDNLSRPRHVNASPAAFGLQRALADRAAELDGEESN
jgi:hypothetical protein